MGSLLLLSKPKGASFYTLMGSNPDASLTLRRMHKQDKGIMHKATRKE